jgi:hypothetical protein
VPAEYHVLERQAELLDDLAVNDYSVFVGLAARHKVDPPRHDQHHPDAHWRAAVMLEECVMLRPLPARTHGPMAITDHLRTPRQDIADQKAQAGARTGGSSRISLQLHVEETSIEHDAVGVGLPSGRPAPVPTRQRGKLAIPLSPGQP